MVPGKTLFKQTKTVIHDPWNLLKYKDQRWTTLIHQTWTKGADSILRPGETLEDDFDVSFRRPNAEGGFQQLVQNTVDGSRPGYAGKPYLDQGSFIKEFTEQRIKGDMTTPKFVEYLNKNYSPSSQTDAFSIDNVDRRLRKLQEKELLPKNLMTKGSKLERVVTPEKYISIIGEEEYSKLKDTPTHLKNLYEYELQKKNNPDFLDIRNERTKARTAAMSDLEYEEKRLAPARERNQKIRGTQAKFTVNRKDAKSMAWKDMVSRTYETKGEPYFTFETPIEKGKNYNTADMKDIVLKDKKGNKFTFDTLFDDIKKVSGNDEFKNFKNTYDQRAFMNKEGITTELNKLYGNEPGSMKSVFNVQHIEGFNKAPFKVHMTFGDQNLNEAYSRRTFTADFGKAETLNDVGKIGDANYKPGKKTAINNYYKSLGPDIVAQIGKKPKGEAKTLINLLDKTGIKLTDIQRTGATALETQIKELGGKEKLNQLLFKGGGTEVERGLVQRIISGGGKFALSMLNPMELIKIKNLIGPGALGIMAAFEAGVVTDDVLRMGKPLDESLASNWLFKSFRPHSEEFEKQKNLLQSGKLTGSEKEYALEMMKMEEILKENNRITMMEDTQLLDQGDAGMIDGSPMIPQEKIDDLIQKLTKRFDRVNDYVFVEGSGRQLENKAAMAEKEAAEMAKKNFSPLFGNSGTPLKNRAPRPQNMGRGPMTEKGKMALDFSIPGITNYKNTFTPSDKAISDYYQTKEKPRALNPGEGTLMRMGMGGEGLYGTQEKFNEGGLANLMKKYYDKR
jgi:hypothetical protein